MTSKVRTRFAPSPTGFLHVGGVRTALFAWLVARQAGGEFLLRIEDTDRQRHHDAAEKHIMDSLEWLALKWDGDICRQSDRLDTYKEWAQKLVDGGRAYPETYTPEQLDSLRTKAKQANRPFLYREHRPEKLAAWDGLQALRFKSKPKDYAWDDAVMGRLASGPEAIDDFIILKADGFPTYNFAHIVDDHLMEISHVIRSQEFLPSVPKFLNLYEALGIEHPTLATLPYVLGSQGSKKLSKRDGAKDVLDYAREGFMPDAMVNFLATLGWNDGSDQEIFSRDELLKKFSLKRVQKSGAHFDEQRLLWFNGHYIRGLSPDELEKKAEEFWGKGKGAPNQQKKKVLTLLQERLKFFGELPQLSDFFFSEPEIDRVIGLYTNPVDKALKRLNSAEISKLLKASLAKLESSDFSEEDIKTKLNELLTELRTKPAILFPVIRIAISAQQSTPELFGTLAVLGKEASLSRLRQASQALSQHK